MCLTFKSGIHFELIFVKGTRSVSTYFVYLFSTCGCPVVPAPRVGKASSCTIISPLLLRRAGRVPAFMWLFLALLILFLFPLVPVLWPAPHFVITVVFSKSLTSGSVRLPTWFFLQKCWLFWVFYFCENLELVC